MLSFSCVRSETINLKPGGPFSAFAEAANVAFDQMLQEDFENPITRYLSWYACHLFWKNPPPPAAPGLEAEVETETVEEEDEEVRKLMCHIESIV